jgi:hypothetical protein
MTVVVVATGASSGGGMTVHFTPDAVMTYPPFSNVNGFGKMISPVRSCADRLLISAAAASVSGKS